jgi:septum formation protein
MEKQKIQKILKPLPKTFSVSQNPDSKEKSSKDFKIILASTSPRRKALLARILKNFEIIPSSYEEDMTLKLTPKELAKTLSHGKAAEIAKRERGIIIGADTFISFNNEVLGKPHTKERAKEMLKKLSGKTHEICTGLTIINTETKKEIRECEIAKITFKELTEKEIDDYIATGEPLDKAGAYALQGLAKKFIKRIEGSRSSIIGLPLERLKLELNKMGVETK